MRLIYPQILSSFTHKWWQFILGKLNLLNLYYVDEEIDGKIKNLSSFADGVLFNKEQAVNNIQFLHLHNIENDLIHSKLG